METNLTLLEILGTYIWFSICFSAILSLPIAHILALRYKKSIAKKMDEVADKTGIVEYQNLSTNHRKLKFTCFSKASFNKFQSAINDKFNLLIPLLIASVAYALIYSITSLVKYHNEISFFRIFFHFIAYFIPLHIVIIQKYTLNKKIPFISVFILITILYLMFFWRYEYEKIMYGSVFADATIFLFVTIQPLLFYMLLDFGRTSIFKKIIFILLTPIAPLFFSYFQLLGLSFDWLKTLEFYQIKEILLIFVIILLVVYFLFFKICTSFICKLYSRKKTSDWLLYFDLLFIIMTLWQLTSLQSSKTVLFQLCGCVFAFITYKVILNIGLKMYRKKLPKTARDGLLLLRAFTVSPKAEKFINHFSFYWRDKAPINLIAAPDYATQLLEPHEFIDFLTFKTKDNFIKTENDLTKAVDNIDDCPDPDNRYRINEFFCYQNIWKQTFNKLKDKSCAVLMDLRGLQESNEEDYKNKGVFYEIKQLLYYYDLSKIIFLINSNDNDSQKIEKIMQDCYCKLPKNSNNLNKDNTVQFYQIENNDFKEIEGLIQCLEDIK